MKEHKDIDKLYDEEEKGIIFECRNNEYKV